MSSDNTNVYDGSDLDSIPFRSNGVGEVSSSEPSSAPGTGNSVPTATDLGSLESGLTWSDTSVSYWIAQSSSEYSSSYSLPNEPSTFDALSASGANVMREVFESWDRLTALDIHEASSSANSDVDMRIAGTQATSTAWAYSPGTSVTAGDVWFATHKSYFSIYDDGPQTYLGSYAFSVGMHEVGHALGLKHPHEVTFQQPTALSLEFDALEYTVMSYRSFLGDPTAGNYSVEKWGYPQSPMMLDIAMIQELYGANYGTEAGDTVYTVSASTGEFFIDGVGEGSAGLNRVYRTIWDGDGFDTIDLSNYSRAISIDLNPGQGIDLDVNGNAQRGRLGKLNGNQVYADNHIYMSLLHLGDERSLIEAARAGSGNDILIGNDTDNLFGGGLGDDMITLGAGSDTVAGTFAELDGDTVTDFDVDDVLVVEGSVLSASQVDYDAPSGEVRIDSNGNGVFDRWIFVGTTVSSSSLVVSDDGTDTTIAFGTATPPPPPPPDPTPTPVLPPAGTIMLTPGNDRFDSSSSDALVVYGDDGNDYIVTSKKNDLILGEAGNDNMNGRGGADTLDGGLGSDALRGGGGSDTFLFDVSDFEPTGSYTDTIRDFAIGKDMIVLSGFVAQSFSDLAITSQNGNALITIDGVAKILTNKVSPASLSASDFSFVASPSSAPPDTTVYSRTLTDGNDNLSILDSGSYLAQGLAGNDSLSLGSGDDTIEGGAGADVLDGNDGDDRLVAGEGLDTMSGGAGSDVFVLDFSDTAGRGTIQTDAITDFELGSDVVELSGFGISDVAQLTFASVGSDTRVGINAVQDLVLEGFTDPTLLDNNANFLFV